MITWVQFGHGALIALTCGGAAAGAVAVKLAATDPTGATIAGCISVGCIAIVGPLGRYLPSASPAVNEKAVAVANQKTIDVANAATTPKDPTP